MVRHKHYTFRSGQEVLEHAIRHLSAIRDALDNLQSHEHEERVKLLLTSVAAEHRNVLGSVERLLEDGSDTLRGTYAQYTAEMPMEIEAPDEPLTTLGLIQWLDSLIKPLRQMFHELAENHDSEDSTEAYAGLAQQLESYEMRLSKEYQRTEDL